MIEIMNNDAVLFIQCPTGSVPLGSKHTIEVRARLQLKNASPQDLSVHPDFRLKSVYGHHADLVFDPKTAPWPISLKAGETTEVPLDLVLKSEVLFVSPGQVIEEATCTVTWHTNGQDHKAPSRGRDETFHVSDR